MTKAIAPGQTLFHILLILALPCMPACVHAAGPVWNWSLGPSFLVPNAPDAPNYRYMPDGHIASLPDGQGRSMMFWSTSEDYRSVGSSPFPESQKRLLPDVRVFGYPGGPDNDQWNNGGSWIMAVTRTAGNRLLTFYHAEYHWTPKDSAGIAWKSIAVATSKDNGCTWTSLGQIITSHTPVPASPVWGGCGDDCAVWDPASRRWFCFYQENWLCMAVSPDPLGAPGTWKKYYKGSFSQAGLGGLNSPIPKLERRSGTNPSVHYNTYLHRWIMVYGGWDGVLYISGSPNLIDWDDPKPIARTELGGGLANPTIIGQSDTRAGRTARLYYQDYSAGEKTKQFRVRSIAFK